MRISDWSSDVCSSDLSAPSLQGKGWEGCPAAPVEIRSTDCRIRTAMGFAALYPSYELTWGLGSRSPSYRPSVRVGRASRQAGHGWPARESGQDDLLREKRGRTEENTSAIQTIMRNS